MSTHSAPRGLVYVLTFPNGKEYVGQTAGPMWQRLCRHRRDTKRDPERPICAAFLQYGQAAIKVSIIASGIESRSERVALEAKVIAERNTLYPNGLNVAPREGDMRHLQNADVIFRANESKRRFFQNNPEAKAQAIANMRKGFDPEQARALCAARNADPEQRAKAQAARRKAISAPGGKAKMIAAGARRAKLKPDMLDNILLALINGESKSSIARRYGVTPAAIRFFLARHNVTT